MCSDDSKTETNHKAKSCFMLLDSLLRRGHLPYSETKNTLYFRGDSREKVESFNASSRSFKGFLDKLKKIIACTLPPHTPNNYMVAYTVAGVLAQLQKTLAGDKIDINYFDTLADRLKAIIPCTVPRNNYTVAGDKIDINYFDTLADGEKQFVMEYLKENMLNIFYPIGDRNSETPFPKTFKELMLVIKHRIIEPYYYDYDNTMDGMDPSNSISATRLIDIAALFPENEDPLSYIYCITSYRTFKAYELQEQKKARLVMRKKLLCEIYHLATSSAN